jgi:ATP-binding cassette subfamily C (CFTR/MRP) protein 4
VVQLDVSKFSGRALVIVAQDAGNFNESDQRKILLARSIYHKAHIYLFDGVFDGMDASEKKDFFTRICLRELRDQTVIFTNNERTLARLSDKIMVFTDCVIEEQGNIDELDAIDASLFDSIINADNVMGGTKASGFAKLLEQAQDQHDPRGQLSDVSVASTFKSKNIEELTKIANDNHKVEEDDIEIVPLGMILKRYLISNGFNKCSKEFAIIVASVAFALISDIWLGLWSSNALGYTLATYLVVYTLLSIITSIAIIVRNLVVRFGLMENGDKVHFSMVNNILRSKISWFEGNPASRIVYRLTTDQNTVDEGLSGSVINSLELFICLMAGVFIFNFFYYGILMLMTVLILGYMYHLLKLFLSVTSSFYQISAINRARLGGVYLRMLRSSV